MMAANNINEPKIEQVLLDLLAKSLFDVDKTFSKEDVNWRVVWYESYVQAVSLTAFSKITEEDCDVDSLVYIRKQLKNSLRDVIHIYKEHIRLHNIMSEAGIPYVILKGAASAAYYPDPLLRSMGDVDFLVDSSYVDRACEVLEAKGFRKNAKEHEKHIVYCDDKGHYELHITPAGVPKGGSGEEIKKLLKGIIADSEEYETEFGTIRVPSKFHHGLVILLHTYCHLTGEGIGLRQLCDWATFVSSFSDEAFCELFEEKLKSVGLWKFAQILTQVSVACFGCERRSWTGEENTELVDGIIEDIFKNGNLGQKKATGMQESLFIAGDGTKKSVIKHFISSVNEIVYFYWQFTRKFKIFLPIGWLFFGGRYILRSLVGKRPKISIKKLKAETTTRTNIYEELKLFVKE